MGDATHGDTAGAPHRSPPRLRVAVLASGEGTLLQTLLDASGSGAAFEVVLVASDRPGAPALDRARRAGLPTLVLPPTEHADRGAWDAALADALAERGPGLLVLAGFMRLLGPAVLERWPSAIVNSHPSLLPAFPGANAVRDALAAGVRTTGASVISVDAGVDTGPVLAQRSVPVLPEDTVEALHERIKAVERPMLLEVVARTAALPTAPRPAPARGAHP